MNGGRRRILKGMAVAGVASPFLGHVFPSQAGTADAATNGTLAIPTLALVCPGRIGSAFADGARAASGTALRVQEASRELADLLGVEALLCRGDGLRIIGLVDNALAAPLLELARGAGARMHWVGQHTAGPGISRHRLLDTDLAAGHVRQLGRQLHLTAGGFTLDEERQGRVGMPLQLSGRGGAEDRPDQWAAGVGYVLAALGSRPPGRAPLQPSGGMPTTGSFVSFAIES